MDEFKDLTVSALTNTATKNNNNVESLQKELLEFEQQQQQITDVKQQKKNKKGVNILDQKKMQNLRTKIQLYKKHFENDLTMVNIDNLDSFSLLELESKFNECKIAVNAKPHGLISLTYNAGINIMESLASFTPFRLQGLSNASQQNIEIQKALIELEIEYGDFSIVDTSEKKLLISTLQCMYSVHKYNSDEAFRSIVNNQFAKNEAVSDKMQQEYVDV